jgi:hypothetical protein
MLLALGSKFGIGVPIVEIYHPVYIDLETIVCSKLKEDTRLDEKPNLPSETVNASAEA